jgi:hypothetical protein
MGFLDKMKGMVNAVTGGAANVTLEYEPRAASPGDVVKVKVTTSSTGGEIKSGGVYVDVKGLESIDLPRGTAMNQDHAVSTSNDTHAQEIQIAPAFVLAAGETRTFEGTITLPADAQPSFKGRHAKHEWKVRGRLDAVGNDPSSEWQDLHVGTKTA